MDLSHVLLSQSHLYLYLNKNPGNVDLEVMDIVF